MIHSVMLPMSYYL